MHGFLPLDILFNILMLSYIFFKLVTIFWLIKGKLLGVNLRIWSFVRFTSGVELTEIKLAIKTNKVNFNIYYVKRDLY